jgi:hypothetical protein
VPGLSVNVSLDGASAQLHDAARGVPGSWRRAVEAMALLRARDVPVTAVHVVAPLNAAWVGHLLEHLWLLGVGVVRLTPVVPIGAASRRTGWGIDRADLRRTVDEARRRFGEDFRAVVQSGVPALLESDGAHAPASLLVRPSGTVTTDSLHPFAFGHVDDGLASCWQRVVAGWDSADVKTWARSVSRASGLARAPVVPYADSEPPAEPPPGVPVVNRRRPSRRERAQPKPAPRLPRRASDSTQPAPTPGDLAAARAHLLSLGLAKRYQVAPLRWSGNSDGERVVRVLEDGRMCRLNGTAGAVLDRVDGMTGAHVVWSLSELYPGIAPDRLAVDTLRVIRALAARGMLRGAAPSPVS